MSEKQKPTLNREQRRKLNRLAPRLEVMRKPSEQFAQLPDDIRRQALLQIMADLEANKHLFEYEGDEQNGDSITEEN